MNFYDFYTGRVFDAYTWLGAHKENNGYRFRTFAPGANGITVLIDGNEYPMQKVHDGNFYEAFIENLTEGQTYEYRIYKRNYHTDHCDPFGFGMELRPNHKSILRDTNDYKFSDDSWMKKRNNCKEAALNIYEIHAGSFRKPSDTNTEWYNYTELADRLIPYLKESGYNYVEFMPISEHPCDESWGYQNTGFFAPSSRYGTARQLKEMIDKFHNNQIGVILDYVPVHFAVDEYALAQYDGTALFEYPHQDVGVSEWGSHNFMHSRGEVRSFLQSAANYWLQEYHFDGLRMDAISRIIYWQGDERRGVNGNAVEFIKFMNSGLKQRNPGCLLAAEDSTNFPSVTKNVNEGGLGFDYKWDMGWMHDTLNYFQTAPEYRTDNYHKLTFSMMYYYNEHYMLPLSHDEVVHGKATILQKMHGDYDNKFPQARAMYMYMMIHPGKKLNFMGNEIGQLREWDEKREQDWMLLDYPIHSCFYKYMCSLNNTYLNQKAMYKWDYKEEGFKWLDCHQEHRKLYAIERAYENEKIVAIFNFSNEVQTNYDVKIRGCTASSKTLLYSDWTEFGGNTGNGSENVNIYEDGITCTLAPYSGIMFEII